MGITVGSKARLTIIAVVLAVAIAVIAGPLAGKAYAAAVSFEDTSSKTWVVAPVEADNISGSMPVSFMDEEGYYLTDATVTNAKSSNKKVATVEVYGSTLWINYGAKTGKTTISCTVNGVAMSHVFQVKYTCPVKTFKVNGTSMLKQVKKKNYVTTKKTYKNKKVVVKTKKNWVITNAQLVKNGKYKDKTVKNKKSYTAKITTKMPYDGITLTFKNTKTEEVQTVAFVKYYDMRYATAG